MGIPDYLTIHPTTAKRFGVSEQEFQTKQLHGSFIRWLVDENGRLIQYPVGFKGEDGEPMPQGTRVDLHGDLMLTGFDDHGSVYSVVVRFTEGELTGIFDEGEYPETLKDLGNF